MINCSFCKKEISSDGYILRHEKSCYMNPLNIKNCEICGKIVKDFKNTVTCSYSCSNKKFRANKNNGNWKESSYRSTCFLFHEKKCVICEEDKIVEVHHMDNNRNNNDPNNLIPLCPTHHKYYHSRYRSLVENEILKYIKNWSG